MRFGGEAAKVTLAVPLAHLRAGWSTFRHVPAIVSFMRIMTCNVNGIRSAESKGFWRWAVRQKADVICLQEIRAEVEKIPRAMVSPKGYFPYFYSASRPGYSGVAMYSRQEPQKVQYGMGFKEMDEEGRYLQLDFPDVSVVSVYFPSGSNREERQKVKYQFMDFFRDHAKRLFGKKREFIFCGDFNIAHKEIDIKNWKANQKTSGFLPEERAWLDTLFDEDGWVDAFRVVNQKPDQYTWWSNRGRAYEKNVGWRIDYHVVTAGLRDKVQDAKVYKGTKFSDHAPLTIDYDI